MIIAGFLILVKSADLVIRRVVKISRQLGFSEYVVSFLAIGVVSVLPELVIGLNSAIEGVSSFGLGIIFGSNIADLTLIIGLLVLLAPKVRIREKVFKNFLPLLFLIFLPVLLLFDGEISRIDGLILLLVFFGYCFKIYTSEHELNRVFAKKEKVNLAFEFACLAVLLCVLFASGFLITEGSKAISSLLAFPLFFIGILFAVGTCLPELVFSLQASKKNHTELGFGDVLGNVFADCTLTIGLVSLINPIKPVHNSLALSSGLLMVLSFILLLILLFKKKQISKLIGILLVFFYLLFIILQFITEQALVQ